MSLSSSIDLRRNAGLRAAFFASMADMPKSKTHTRKESPRKCFIFRLEQVANLTNGPVKIGNPWHCQRTMAT